MSPFLFRIGRLAWARGYYAAIGGWRRLVWRLWYDLGIPEPKPVRKVIYPPPPPPKILHYLRPGNGGNHWCGADWTTPYTIVWEDVSCDKCIRDALMTRVAYQTNTR